MDDDDLIIVYTALYQQDLAMMLMVVSILVVNIPINVSIVSDVLIARIAIIVALVKIHHFSLFVIHVISV
jgi:hypothetical protein